MNFKNIISMPILLCAFCGCSYNLSNDNKDASKHYIIGFGIITKQAEGSGHDGQVVETEIYGMNIVNEGLTLGVSRTEVVLLPESSGVYIKLHKDADPEAISKILNLVNSTEPTILSPN